MNEILINSLINKKFNLIILIIFITELLSFLGYFFPLFNQSMFIILSIFFLIISLWRLEYGLLILLAELFIGSFGYLFYFEYHGFTLSIRLALWLIVMSVWLEKTMVDWFKRKRLEVEFGQSIFFHFYIILFIFILWGVINGLLNNNYLSYVIQDAQRWLYFALILPIFAVIKNIATIKNILRILLAAITWLSLETIFLLYVFSHNLNGFAQTLYRWVRLSEVGEVTQIQGGFFRIFFQSHIHVLIGFFIIILLLTFYLLNKPGKKRLINDKNFLILFGLICLCLTAILISFSRSFWFGLFGGMIILWLIWLIGLKLSWQKFFFINSLLFLATVISFLLIITAVKLPYPRPTGGFNTTDLFGARATLISGEAGASSRWALLPKLWSGIIRSPILGHGFGSTITYYTNDPRILQSNPSGEYTTYAFEWGWLDIWLKLGLIGLIVYLILWSKIIITAIKIKLSGIEKMIILGLATGAFVLILVNVFSPYVNHPLGIGYLMIISALVDYYYKQAKALA